ncbi:MAG: hypothetical protein RR623_07545 [Bacilli bacterium]
MYLKMKTTEDQLIYINHEKIEYIKENHRGTEIGLSSGTFEVVTAKFEKIASALKKLEVQEDMISIIHHD